MPQHWLMKSEPDEFSIDDLERRGSEPWTGVRNYQARNFMRTMRAGDRVLFYHSSCAEPGIAGLARIGGAAYPDPTQFDPKSPYYDARSPRDAPRWLCIDVQRQRRFARVVPLRLIKQRAERFTGLTLLRPGNRLSVFPVSAAHYQALLKLEDCA